MTDTKDLKVLTNEELYIHGTMLGKVTPLENELLHRLEQYIDLYGDYTSEAYDLDDEV